MRAEPVKIHERSIVGGRRAGSLMKDEIHNTVFEEDQQARGHFWTISESFRDFKCY